MRRARGAIVALLIAPAIALAFSKPVGAVSLLADLSKHLVAITTGFAGTDILLFGSLEGGGDVVVVVRGPEREVTMHRKSRVLGVWANTATMVFRKAPSFYAVAASRPIEDIASPSVLARHEIGLAHLRLDLPRAMASPNLAKEWRAGLIRNQQALGLYGSEVGRVDVLGNRLFRTDLQLPANVPVGTYQVHVYLLRDGHIISAQTTPLIVNKVGTEAMVFDFAHQYSALYGLIAILLALVAGWLAYMAFRKA